LTYLIRTRIRWQIDSFKKSFLQFQKRPFNAFFPTEIIETIIAQPQNEPWSFRRVHPLKALFLKY
jgi:hypothetical protein